MVESPYIHFAEVEEGSGNGLEMKTRNSSRSIFRLFRRCIPIEILGQRLVEKGFLRTRDRGWSQAFT